MCSLRFIHAGAYAGHTCAAPTSAPGIGAGKGAYIIKKNIYKIIKQSYKMVSFVDKFTILYAKTWGEQPPPVQKLKEINQQLSQKYISKYAAKYQIYADEPDTYQANLMFEPYVNSKKKKLYMLFSNHSC